jgi:hypothetical protein
MRTHAAGRSCVTGKQEVNRSKAGLPIASLVMAGASYFQVAD